MHKPAKARSACRLQDDLPAPTNFYSGVMVSSVIEKKLMSDISLEIQDRDFFLRAATGARLA